MPINMPSGKNKESALDKITKALQVAQTAFSIPVEWEKLQSLKQDQAAKAAEQNRISNGILTPKEVADYGKDYAVSPTESAGAFKLQVPDAATPGGTKPVYLTPKKKETEGLDILLKSLDIKGKQLDNDKKTKEAGSAKAEFDQLPVESQAEIKNLAESNAKKTAVRNQLAATLETLRSDKVPYEQKLLAGRNMAKVLNSTEGADAVGNQEADRMLAFLNYLPTNRPGWDVGPQIDKFADQVDLKVRDIDQAVMSNKGQINKLYGRSGEAVQVNFPEPRGSKKPGQGKSPLIPEVQAAEKPPANDIQAAALAEIERRKAAKAKGAKQ